MVINKIKLERFKCFQNSGDIALAPDSPAGSAAIQLEFASDEPQPPRNDFVKAFFELLLDPARRSENWASWEAPTRKGAKM